MGGGNSKNILMVKYAGYNQHANSQESGEQHIDDVKGDGGDDADEDGYDIITRFCIFSVSMSMASLGIFF
jgi:hypothetical protein